MFEMHSIDCSNSLLGGQIFIDLPCFVEKPAFESTDVEKIYMKERDGAHCSNFPVALSGSILF
jgi:hypothetical protein